jgi:hypothetical protein
MEMRRNIIVTALLGLLLGGLLAGSSDAVRAQDATPSANDPAANKALVLRYEEEVWNQGNTDVVYEVLAPEFIWRFSSTEIFLVGPDAVKAHADNLNSQIEGMGLTVDIALAEDDLVAIRWSLTSTSVATPATTTLLCTGNDIYRIDNGLIAESWQESASCA